MRWGSWGEFWAMGGYAVYVWGSVAVTAAALALEVVQARWAHRVALRQLKAQHALAHAAHDETSVEKVM